MSNNTTRPKILIPTKTEDQQLLAAALADPDAQPLSEEQLSQMCPLSKNSANLTIDLLDIDITPFKIGSP